MNTLTVIPDQPNITAIVQTVLDSVDSPHTRRAYQRALQDFLTWYQVTGRAALSKMTVQRYSQELHAQGVSASSINQRLSAIRKLAGEASDNGMLPDALANGIRNVKGIRQEGKRLGNWLDKKQAQAMLRLPDTGTLKGLRDRALLAVLIGAGLRRQEASNLTFEHLQQREGRWIITDLIGKRNKVRSVPIPSWVKAAIDAWSDQASINTSLIFRPINKADKLAGDSMTDQAIYYVIAGYAEQIGIEVAPHDLRRTFAKLAHKGGAAIDQIQLSLGHSSVKTTETYLGVDQDLTDAPCDHLGLRL